ncbi:MAG TPA: hypothetical protein VIK11_08880, partial [Tepidiformaceae bacterium]
RSIVVHESERFHTGAAQARERTAPQISSAEEEKIRSGAAGEPVEERPFLAGYRDRRIGV